MVNLTDTVERTMKITKATRTTVTATDTAQSARPNLEGEQRQMVKSSDTAEWHTRGPNRNSDKRHSNRHRRIG